MSPRCRRVRTMRPFLLCAIAFSVARPLAAQSPVAGSEPTIAVVVEDDTLVRSGPHDSYYPFGRLTAGSPVLIVGEKDEWVQVRTVGPAFDQLFGYIRYRPEDGARVQLSEDGKTAVVVTRVDVLAPNLNTNAKPSDSWKSLARLEPGATLTLVETRQLDRETVHTVVLPPTGVGWLYSAGLRHATSSEGAPLRGALALARREQPSAPARPETPQTAPPAPANYVLAREEPNALTLEPPPFIARPPTAAKAQQRRQPASPRGTERAQAPEPQQAIKPPAEPKPTEGKKEDRAVAAAAPKAPPRAPAKATEPQAQGRAELQEILEDLEEAYVELGKEEIITAEVIPLRELYLDLAARSGEEISIARYAESRAEQLLIWSQLQERRRELNQIRSRITMAKDEAIAYRLALESSSNYVAVGRVMASSVYDGTRLPLLLRLQEPSTGRTIAYLQPNSGEGARDAQRHIGQLVGIVGTKAYDGSLRLTLVNVERIEPLSSSSSSHAHRRLDAETLETVGARSGLVGSNPRRRVAVAQALLRRGKFPPHPLFVDSETPRGLTSTNGAYRARTGNLCLAKAALSQLS